ncbi:MAG: V-type ATP synthase subunit D [Lentisphaeria bacterium]|nr:V-type ATP synthase subunit D [Lentisphaeria bacterium]
MSVKLKFTKDSLSKEKRALARFSRFLPTLKLRKTQLFNEIHRLQEEMEEKDSRLVELNSDIDQWVAVFAEDVDVESYFGVEEVITGRGNVAGIDIPVFKDVVFKKAEYDLMAMPFWLDAGLEALKDTVLLQEELKVLNEQVEIIQKELTTTVQRINLFEKVKIPQTQDNIRRIRIFLGDQQTAGVVRGKMTKGKLERKRKAAAA